MHEFALAQSIVETIKDQVTEDLSTIEQVTIDVGHFSGVVTDSLEFGLTTIFNENNLPHVVIVINNVPTIVKCQCGEEYEIKDIFESCPVCQSYNRKVISGMDIVINSIQLRED